MQEGGTFYYMMKYEIFKEVVVDTFKDYLPEQYKNMEVQVVSANKVNRVMDGINLINPGVDKNVSPTIYINDMYDHYKLCNDLKEAIRSGAERMVKAFSICPDVPKIELAEARDNIVFQLVNTEQNKDMLANIPHREYQDLSVIYRWVVKIEDEGVQSIMLRNELAEQLGLNEEQLFKLAAENTRRIFPPVVKSMNEIIREMFVKDGMPREVAEMVSEINMDQVALEERLSHQVYHYDKDLRKLSLATDTPNKRLDGMVAEPPMVYETKQSR